MLRGNTRWLRIWWTPDCSFPPLTSLILCILPLFPFSSARLLHVSHCYSGDRDRGELWLFPLYFYEADTLPLGCKQALFFSRHKSSMNSTVKSRPVRNQSSQPWWEFSLAFILYIYLMRSRKLATLLYCTWLCLGFGSCCLFKTE